MVSWIVAAIGIPVPPRLSRVLIDEPACPAVIVAMPHQHHLRVPVRLTPVPAPELEGRRSCSRCGQHCPEGRRVLIERLALAGSVHRPQVAELVVGIIKARPVPMLTQPRRVDREAVRQYRRAGTCAVTQVGMRSLAVGHAHAQAEAVVGVSVNLARIGGLDEPVFVVVSIPVEQTPKAQARLVAVRIVAVGFALRVPEVSLSWAS